MRGGLFLWDLISEDKLPVLGPSIVIYRLFSGRVALTILAHVLILVVDSRIIGGYNRTHPLKQVVSLARNTKKC